MTLFDNSNQLKFEYDNLIKTRGKPTHVQIAAKYFCTENFFTSKILLASMAGHLQPKWLRAIGKTMNSEDHSLCLNNDIIDSRTATEQVMKTVECHVFRSLHTLHSVQMPTSFMNAKLDLENLAQTNTVHPGKDYLLICNFSPCNIQSSTKYTNSLSTL